MRFTLAGIPSTSRESRTASSSVSFTPPSSTYSKVMRRPFFMGKSRQAASRSPSGQRRLSGMSALRTSSVVAFSETASFTSVSSPKRRISGTIPAVETVTWRLEKLGPSSESRTSRAALTLSKLWSGSPIPMKTRLVSGRGGEPSSSSIRRRLARATWSTISPEVRFRASPIVPVMQKVQPTAQPTWVETQRVFRSVSGM